MQPPKRSEGEADDYIDVAVAIGAAQHFPIAIHRSERFPVCRWNYHVHFRPLLAMRWIDKARGPLVGVAPGDESVAFVTTDGAVAVVASSVRAAARDGGGSKVTGVSGGVQRVVKVTGGDEE